jgi:hypothetical protein
MASPMRSSANSFSTIFSKWGDFDARLRIALSTSLISSLPIRLEVQGFVDLLWRGLLGLLLEAVCDDDRGGGPPEAEKAEDPPAQPNSALPQILPAQFFEILNGDHGLAFDQLENRQDIRQGSVIKFIQQLLHGLTSGCVSVELNDTFHD